MISPPYYVTAASNSHVTEDERGRSAPFPADVCQMVKQWKSMCSLTDPGITTDNPQQVDFWEVAKECGVVSKGAA